MGAGLSSLRTSRLSALRIRVEAAKCDESGSSAGHEVGLSSNIVDHAIARALTACRSTVVHIVPAMETMVNSVMTAASINSILLMSPARALDAGSSINCRRRIRCSAQALMSEQIRSCSLPRMPIVSLLTPARSDAYHAIPTPPRQSHGVYSCPSRTCTPGYNPSEPCMRFFYGNEPLSPAEALHLKPNQIAGGSSGLSEHPQSLARHPSQSASHLSAGRVLCLRQLRLCQRQHRHGPTASPPLRHLRPAFGTICRRLCLNRGHSAP